MRSQLFFSSKATLNRVACLFLNQPCPLCDRPTPKTFCVDCDRQLFQSFQNKSPQKPANPRSPTAPPITALGQYGGPLKQAISAMKYRNRPDVAFPLGAALAKRWNSQTHNPKPSALYALPIPLHTDRQKSRGYNQAERIAAAFCKVSRLPLLPHGLQRIKSTQPQHSLGLTERQKNLTQVFQIGKTLQRLAGQHPAILIIDDIYTTGATAQSAVHTLEEAGFPVMGIAVLAQAQLT